MSIKLLRKFVGWSITDQKGNFLLLFFQILLGASGVAYAMFPVHQVFFESVFVLLAIILILWILLILFIRNSYSINALMVNPDTGVLYDKKIDLENVSLRKSAIKKILSGVLLESKDRAKVLRDIGYEIGESFAVDYESHLRKHRGKAIDKKKTLQEMLEYDSSSGMGKLELLKMPQVPSDFAEILIKNPFTSLERNGQKNIFLLGYIEGVLHGLFREHHFKAIARLPAADVSEIRVQIVVDKQ